MMKRGSTCSRFYSCVPFVVSIDQRKNFSTHKDFFRKEKTSVNSGEAPETTIFPDSVEDKLILISQW